MDRCPTARERAYHFEKELISLACAAAEQVGDALQRERDVKAIVDRSCALEIVVQIARCATRADFTARACGVVLAEYCKGMAGDAGGDPYLESMRQRVADAWADARQAANVCRRALQLAIAKKALDAGELFDDPTPAVVPVEARAAAQVEIARSMRGAAIEAVTLRQAAGGEK